MCSIGRAKRKTYAKNDGLHIDFHFSIFNPLPLDVNRCATNPGASYQEEWHPLAMARSMISPREKPDLHQHPMSISKMGLRKKIRAKTVVKPLE